MFDFIFKKFENIHFVFRRGIHTFHDLMSFNTNINILKGKSYSIEKYIQPAIILFCIKTFGRRNSDSGYSTLPIILNDTEYILKVQYEFNIYVNTFKIYEKGEDVFVSRALESEIVDFLVEKYKLKEIIESFFILNNSRLQNLTVTEIGEFMEKHYVGDVVQLEFDFNNF